MRACKCDGMRAGDALISQTRMQGGFPAGYRTRCDRGNEDVAMLEVGIVSRCPLNGPRSSMALDPVGRSSRLPQRTCPAARIPPIS